MEKRVLNQTLTLEEAPVHVAPGGSVLFQLKGNATQLAAFLKALREEIAYGMADITTIDDQTVQADIYMGNADVDSFNEMLPEGIEKTSHDIAENTEQIGLSMRARNQVIEAIGGK